MPRRLDVCGLDVSRGLKGSTSHEIESLHAANFEPLWEFTSLHEELAVSSGASTYLFDGFSVKDAEPLGLYVMDDDEDDDREDVARRCVPSEKLKLVESPSSGKLQVQRDERGLGEATSVNSG